MQIRVLELTAGVAVGAPLGGAARFVIELTRAFDRSNVEPFLASIWEYGTPAEANWQAVLQAESISHGFASAWVPGQPLLSCVCGLRGLWQLREFRPDIIHSHGEFTDIAAILLKRRLGAHYLVRTRHSIVEWPKRPALGRIFGHWLYPGVFDAEIAVSKSAAMALDRRVLAHWLNRRACTIHNAIDFDRFESSVTDRVSIRERLDLPGQVPVLGTIGSLVKLKGYDTLLNGLSYILQTFNDVYLIIIGDGPERARLESLARELDVQERVRFMGAHTHVEQIMPAFDLFVSSSLVEGLPTVILESIAAGIPVIATDIPGNKEVIEDGVTGRLVPPEDPQALTAAIVDALRSPDLTQVMARNARQIADSRFAIRTIAAQYVTLFQRLMGEAQGVG